MLGLSASFLLLSYFLTWLFGGVGFILANCCNMALRIIHSLIYIHRYFLHSDHTPLSGLRPHPTLLIALTISSILTAFSEVKLTIINKYSCQSRLAIAFQFILSSLNFSVHCVVTVAGCWGWRISPSEQFVYWLWSRWRFLQKEDLFSSSELSYYPTTAKNAHELVSSNIQWDLSVWCWTMYCLDTFRYLLELCR